MKTIGNILWFILGGLVSAILWTIYGILWCITIIGIPLGSVCFKMASLSLWPFGREVEFNGGFPSIVANVLWVKQALRWPLLMPLLVLFYALQ